MCRWSDERFGDSCNIPIELRAELGTTPPITPLEVIFRLRLLVAVREYQSSRTIFMGRLTAEDAISFPQRLEYQFAMTQNLFRLSRHQLQAVNYRFLRTQAFQVWQEVVCA